MTFGEMKKPLLSKEHIIHWLTSFKGGNVTGEFLDWYAKTHPIEWGKLQVKRRK